MILSRRVWEQFIPRGPWFRWTNDPSSELLAPDPVIKGGEDYYLCHALQNKAKIWMYKAPIGHLKTVDVTRMACMAQGLKGGGS